MLKIVTRSHPTLEQYWQICRRALANVLERKDVGFARLPERQDLLQAVQNLAKQFSDHKDVVVVGVGGSSLGPKALYELYKTSDKEVRLHFCDNVDPMEFQRMLASLRDLSQTLWIFTSKSGTTIETLLALEYVTQIYRDRNLSLKGHAVVISETKESTLTKWAKEVEAPVLEIPENVGGRYSVLSPVGMFPMELYGLPAAEFLKGAEKAVADTEKVSEVMAQFLESFDRDEWISFFWFYMSSFHGFGWWLMQLWAESLAKLKTRGGEKAPRVSTPMSAIGSCDQHSLLQQVMEGARDKFVVFTRIRQLEETNLKLSHPQFPELDFFKGKNMGALLRAQAQGTERALREQDVSTLELELEGFGPAHLGYYLMFWELVVAGLGEALDLNAFDQPGVELGKRLARKILTT